MSQAQWPNGTLRHAPVLGRRHHHQEGSVWICPGVIRCRINPHTEMRWVSFLFWPCKIRQYIRSHSFGEFLGCGPTSHSLKMTSVSCMWRRCSLIVECEQHKDSRNFNGVAQYKKGGAEREGIWLICMSRERSHDTACYIGFFDAQAPLVHHRSMQGQKERSRLSALESELPQPGSLRHYRRWDEELGYGR